MMREHATNPPNLDKSAQKRNTAKHSDSRMRSNSGASEQQTRLKKRARKQALGFAIKKKMIEANPNSPLIKHYINALSCSKTIAVEDGKVRTHYCNSRLCPVCNSIRTAKLMDGYLPTIEKWDEKYMVTLTIKNMRARQLKERIEQMQHIWRLITDLLRKRAKKGIIDAFEGLRKIEVTFNKKENTYHPHYHILVNSKEVAEMILYEWLKKWKEIDKSIISRKAQDIRQADDDAIKELFKYFTKILNNKELHAKSLDVIMRALYGKRVYNPFGNLKKIVTEDVDELDEVVYDEIEEAKELAGTDKLVFEYIPELFDWVEINTGLLLTNYQPSDVFFELIGKINSS